MYALNIMCVKGDGCGKKVREVMKPLELFPVVSMQSDMYQVIQLLRDRSKDDAFYKAAVVESDGKPVGLVTMRNIFEAMEPEAFHISQWSVPVFWPGLWQEQIEHLKKVSVCDYFFPAKMAGVQIDYDLMRTIYCFNRTKTPALAVLKGWDMVGIVETLDVLGEILQNVDSSC